jgi:uncharacterized protein YdeI (YjbR/CyaY-like superfamily)
MHSPLQWVIVRIPLDVHKIWGERGQLRVKGEINGFAFRTSLFPNGRGGHYLLVNKRMQAGSRTAPGMTAQFLLEPDTEKRVITEPAELKKALAADRSLRRWFDKLNPSKRNEIAKLVLQPKSAAARSRRAEQMAELLLATMEAERELPPLIKLALARNSQAQQGWQRMSAARRRGHLMGIFYYRTPEARARRLAKAMQEAMQLATR